MTNQWTVALVVVGVMACSSQVPLDKSPCPCPASLGYICCGSGSAQSCVRAQTCDTAPVVDSGPWMPDAYPPPDAGPPDVPTVSSQFLTIAIGHAHACSVRFDYSVDCIGDDSKGQATPPPGQFYTVLAGGDVTCGSKVDKSDVTKDGAWVCWGDNTYGQTAVPSGVTVAAIGLRHACGTDGTNHVVCWGDNSLGQAMPPPGVYTNLTAGHNHTCGARQDDGTDAGVPLGIVCWGDNSLGQLTPPPAFAGFLAADLTAGGDHTCFDTFPDGQLWCWGDNAGGQSTPPAGNRFGPLAVGPGHACAMNSDFKIVCWGNDWGDATPIPPSGSFGGIRGGDYRTCAWKHTEPASPAICWGATYEPWY